MRVDDGEREKASRRMRELLVSNIAIYSLECLGFPVPIRVRILAFSCSDQDLEDFCEIWKINHILNPI